MLMLESMTLISGTGPSSNDASFERSSSRNSSPVPAWKITEKYVIFFCQETPFDLMEVEQTFTKTLKRTNDFMNHLRFEIASRFFLRCY